MRIHHWTLPILLALCAPASSASAQDCEGWHDRSTTPGGRLGHAMAFDSTRGVTVLFGGSDVKSHFGDTWEWNGATWTLHDASGPSPRIGHALAYDSFRRVVVLFGGADESGVFGDTWEWNGIAWSLRTGAGPEARYGHSLAYDANRHVVVLFGGSSATAPASKSVWEWNGSTWAQRTATGPAPRNGQGMAFDSGRNVTVLYGGGLGARGSSSETWEWNGAAWALRTSSGPRAQSNPQLVYDNQRNAVLLFGAGNVEGGTGETWQWNGAVWSLRAVTGPPFREGQAMGFDSTRGRAVLFGGDVPPRNETWEWDGVSWSPRMGGGTRPRSAAAMAYDSGRARTVLFGGASDGVDGARTLEWDGTTWTVASSVGPLPRESHALAYDSVRGVTVLFGGRSVINDQTDGGSGDDFSVEFGDTWEWNGAVWLRRSSSGPTPRYGHALAYDARRGVTVLFGGVAFDGIQETSVRDTWEWNGATWTRRSTTGPPARFGHVMTYDPLRDVTVLFGGRDCANSCCDTLGDTWVWNGLAWTRRTVSGPAPRSESAMAYDPVAGLSLLFGGRDGSEVRYDDLWQWNGAAWARRSDLGPRGRAGHGMVYDIARRSAFLSGGVGGYGDAWEYGCDAPCSETALAAPEPERYSRCPGSPCYATKNRYLSFIPPVPLCGETNTALRVTLGPMSGPNDCPGIPDFSRFNGTVMWVGSEILYGDEVLEPTGVYQLQSTPRFRDWRSVAGGVVYVADCNVVPCATYTIDVVSEEGLATGNYSPPLVLGTTPLWGDLVGVGTTPADGVVDAIDIVAVLDRFKNLPSSPPRSWCDLFDNRPFQGSLQNIDASDVSAVVDAFRGLAYPFSGPSAPANCPGGP